jgi:hypothetical protein
VGILKSSSLLFLSIIMDLSLRVVPKAKTAKESHNILMTGSKINSGDITNSLIEIRIQ